MPRMTFIEHNGTRHAVELQEGQSLMQLAVDNAVPGIDADCGGECACGTCHVIVADEWFDQMGERKSDEQQMLSMTPEATASSRLACQIQVTDAMDGLVVRLPEFQM